jgi:hypothetical protein
MSEVFLLSRRGMDLIRGRLRFLGDSIVADGELNRLDGVKSPIGGQTGGKFDSKGEMMMIVPLNLGRLREGDPF